jgi:hypothetical protein
VIPASHRIGSAEAEGAHHRHRRLSAPLSLHYEVFDAISDNRWHRRDNRRARELFGWQPTGHAADYSLGDGS